jgi:hypothetical protein
MDHSLAIGSRGTVAIEPKSRETGGDRLTLDVVHVARGYCRAVPMQRALAGYIGREVKC